MAGVGGRSVLAPKFKTVLVHGPYSVMNKRARPEHDWKICMAKLWDSLKLRLYVLYVRTYESENTEYTDHDYTEYVNAFYDSLSMQTRFTIH